MNSVAIDRPTRALVVILEDEQTDSERICTDLDRDGILRHVLTRNFAEFFDIIEDRTNRVYVASIDWYIGTTVVGRKAVQEVKRRQPWAVTIVYSNDTTVEFDALNSLGADFFFDKGSLRPEDYQQRLKDAARLGMNRYIAHMLKEMGRVLALPERSLLDAETEHELFVLAREALQQQIQQEEDWGELHDLLIQRGWHIDASAHQNQSSTRETSHLSDIELAHFYNHTGGNILLEIVETHLLECNDCAKQLVAYVRNNMRGTVQEPMPALEAPEAGMHEPNKPTDTQNQEHELERYDCWVDAIRDGVAYLTLTDSEERLIKAKHDAAALQHLGFDEGDFLRCRVILTNDGVAVKFEAAEAPIISEEEWQRSLAEVEAQIGTEEWKETVHDEGGAAVATGANDHEA